MGAFASLGQAEECERQRVDENAAAHDTASFENRFLGGRHPLHEPSGQSSLPHCQQIGAPPPSSPEMSVIGECLLLSLPLSCLGLGAPTDVSGEDFGSRAFGLMFGPSE